MYIRTKGRKDAGEYIFNVPNCSGIVKIIEKNGQLMKFAHHLSGHPCQVLEFIYSVSMSII
jgi:hypothetical protein